MPTRGYRKGRVVNKYPRYDENPFLKRLVNESKSKTVKVKGKKDKVEATGKYIINPRDNEEFQATQEVILYEKQVETNEFIKIYSTAMKKLLGLNAAGTAVFTILLDQIMGYEHKNATKVYLYYGTLPEAIKEKISSSKFNSGINNLIDNDFLALSTAPYIYYFNPLYIHNGDRLAIAEIYTKKREPTPKWKLANQPKLTKDIQRAIDDEENIAALDAATDYLEEDDPEIRSVSETKHMEILR